MRSDLAKAYVLDAPVQHKVAPMGRARLAELVTRGQAIRAELTKAAQYDRVAERITDPQLRDGYQKAAAAIRAKYPPQLVKGRR